MSVSVQEQSNQERYLAVCNENPDEKFEFINGEIYAMGNTSFNHDLVKSELGFHIRDHFSNNQINCRVIIEGKLSIGKNYFIPDIMVVCKKTEEAAFSDPVVIVEVLSDGTRAKDFGIKFKEYQKLETLEEYIVLEQDLMEAIFFSKKDNWKGTVCVIGDVLRLESIGFSIAIETIYKDVILRKSQ